MNKLSSIVLLAVLFQFAAAGLRTTNAVSLTELSKAHWALFESPNSRIVSDDDQASMQSIKHHIQNDFSEFKSIQEVHDFLDKVKLLVQKHPKNTAYAQGDRKELLKFLSQDIITKLIRVDTEPFIMPLSDDKIPLAQKAVDEDELTRRLFGAPLRSWIEVRKQQLSRTEDGNHEKDGTNFFTNFWCKISGSCSQHQ